MNNNCIGLMGWLFGHKTESFIIQKVPIPDYNISSHNTTINVDIKASHKFEIRCKRCMLSANAAGGRCEQR